MAYGIGGVLALLLVLLLLLQIPFIQTKVTHLAVNWLSGKVGSTISVEKIAINFLDNVRVKGIYVEDLEGDTLLYAKDLKVDISLFGLLKSEVNLEKITLDHAVAHLKQAQDSTFSYQFIVDAFASEDTTESTSSFVIKIGEVHLKDIRAKADLLSGNIGANLAQTTLKMKEMDLDKMLFHVVKFEVDSLNLQAKMFDLPPPETLPEAVDTIVPEVIFPLKDLGLTVMVDRLNLKNSNLFYQYGNTENGRYFNPQYVDARNLNIALKDVRVDEKLAQLNVEDISVQLNERFNLKSLKGEISFDEKQAAVRGFELLTARSQGSADVALQYAGYAQLLDMDAQTQAHLMVDSLKLALQDVIYFVPSLDSIAEIQHLKNEMLVVDGLIDGRVDDITVQHLSAQIAWNSVFLSGNVRHAMDMNQLALNNVRVDARTHIAEVKPFLPKGTLKPQADRLGRVELKGALQGTLANLNVQNLELLTQSQTGAKLNGRVQNVMNTERLRYDLSVQHLTTGVKDLEAVMDAPAQLKAVETASFKGKVKGGLYDYDVDGTLNSSVGAIIADLLVKMNKDYSNAEYKGTIALNEIALQKILQNDSLGYLNANIEVDGKGMTLEDLQTQLKLQVDDVTFQGYTFRDLLVNGQVDSKKFDGLIEANDPNAQLRIEGFADLNDSIPVIKVQGQIDTLNLHTMNLLSYPLSVQLKIDADLQGYTVDDILGYASIKDIVLKNDSTTWRADSIHFTAEIPEGKNRELTLQSPVLNAKLTGNYKTADLPVIFTNFADQYFPVSSFVGGPETDDAVSEAKTDSIRQDYVNVEVSIKDPTKLAQMFQVDLRKLDTASLTFSLDAPNNLSDLKLSVPEVQYGDIVIKDIQMSGDNQGGQLKTALSIISVQLSETMSIPTIKVDASMSEKRAKLSAKVVEDSVNYRLGFNAMIDGTGEEMFLNLEDPFYLNFKEWNVLQEAPLNIKNIAEIPTIKLSSNGQSLSVGGDTSLLNVAFAQFDINNILQLIKFDSTTFKGEINGDLKVGLTGAEAPIEGDLSIQKIAVNNQTVGDLKLNADKRGDLVNAVLSLTGGENLLQADAKYNISDGGVNASLDVKNIVLAPFEPFLTSVASNVSGAIKGKIDVKGTVEAPSVNGQLQLDNVSAKVEALGTQYTIKNGTIGITDAAIQPNFVFTDSASNQARLSGSIAHELFQKFRFDLKLDSKNFTFLNSEKLPDALFYGKLYANANATIKGDLDLPVINVKVTTQPKTDVGVQLISGDAILQQESYIVFVDGLDNYTEQQVDSIAKLKYQLSTQIDLTIEVNVTDDATVSIVIDPITGDNLEIRGNAQLLVKIPPSGNLDITGVYTVKEGNYRFSFQNLLKKNFEIVPGGKVTFTGDVMNAMLDIKARYNTQASTLPLLNNDVSMLSESEKDNVRKRANVGVVLNAQGRLSAPELKFDIEIPESSSGPVGSSVTQALDRLRLNESDLNKEVFSLLLFNSFTGSSSTGNIATTGTSTALRSVGDLINTQLNRLASSAEGLEFNFNMDQYDDQVTEGGGQITEVNLGVSQTLFNDKLVISVGGNVDVGSGNEERQGLSGVAGDFVLEYKITEDGKYRVKVFQKTDYDVLNENNLWRTGAGFSYKTKFGKIVKRKK